jgi:hypothetical protein
LQLPAQDGPLEKAFEDGDVLRSRPGGRVAPLVVDELLEPFRADGRLEVLERFETTTL